MPETLPETSSPSPGFRVTADELSNDMALDAMRDAASDLSRTALEARLSLLRLGFADNHSLCVQLDRTAREYASVFEAIRRQRYPAPVIEETPPL
jgi:hypothetical protein